MLFLYVKMLQIDSSRSAFDEFLPDIDLKQMPQQTQFYHHEFCKNTMETHPSNLSFVGLTLAPMRDEKTTFVSAASSTTSCFSILVSGFIVVSHNCSGIISPKPADAQNKQRH